MSDLVQVKIKGMVITAQYGTLSAGTILRTTPAFAKHLVEDCQAAEYVASKAAPAEVKKVSAKGSGSKKKPHITTPPEAVAVLEVAIAELQTRLAEAAEEAKPDLEAELQAKQAELAQLQGE